VSVDLRHVVACLAARLGRGDLIPVGRIGIGPCSTDCNVPEFTAKANTT